MRSHISRAVALTITGLTTIAVPGTNALAAPSTGVELLDVTRVFDSRQPGSGLSSGVERALPASAGDIVDVGLTGGSAAQSWLYLHGCGTPPDRSQPAASAAVGGESWTNMVPVRAGDTCMTLFGDATVVIDRVARIGQPGGLAYVAHPEPVAVPATLSTTGTTHVHVTDATVPANAEAVALWITIDAPDTDLATLVGRACATAGSSQVLATAAGGSTLNLMLLPLDGAGDACFDTLGHAPRSVSVERWGYLAPGVAPTSEGLPFSGFVGQELPGYTAITPRRAFDTRLAGAPVAGRSTYRHTFGDLPVDATAVALNITATDTTGAGFVSAYPCEGDVPEVSNVNFVGAGLTVPNFSIVALGPSREVCFFALTTTHLIADVSGYFADGGGDGYVPRDPVRVFDTRTSGNVIAPGSTYVADLSSYGPMSAAVLNVTVTQPDRPGFVTVYPCDAGTPPTASNLNFGSGQTRPNTVTVRVPSDGKVCFFSSAQIHLVADLGGGYSAASSIGFAQADPWRVFDTRQPPDTSPVAGGTEYIYDLGSTVPRAVAWNVTATDTQAAGFVSLYPCADAIPNASNVNFDTAGATVANFAIVQPSAAGTICLFSPATAHVIADEAGFFADPIPVAVYYDAA